MPVYLVGGPVRDALLGAPVLDLDFSVEGHAVLLAERLAERLGGVCTKHKRFGTATVVALGTRIDLVTARREVYPAPGQLPQIAPGSIADDLARRDFTINAMAFPVSGEDGELLAPIGGLDDLEAGLVRILHPRSFIDDPTRMFRAVRYEQRFGFHIDDGTLECLASAVSDGYLDAVSGDRWRHELERLLQEPHPGPALLRAAELGLLKGVHPSLSKHEGLRTLSAKFGEFPDADECLAALFSQLSALEGESVAHRLRLSGRRAVLARDTIEVGEAEPKIRSASRRPSELYRLLSAFDPTAIAFHARFTDDPLVADSLRQYSETLRFVQTSLSGEELLDMGAPQGPLIGQILAQLRDANLDGLVSGEGEERALVRDLLARDQEGASK